MSDTTATMLQDKLNSIERNVYDGIDFSQEVTTAYVLADELGERIDQLSADNAKLRELSSIMLKCITAKEREALICWECPMHKQFDELRSYCCLKHEAKELGIEVDS